jgi:hypothetical protein
VEYYFERYGDLELHRRMVGDQRRTDAFAQAIKECVHPDDVVLDVGTGTGILAMLCAKAGAKQVYAIDQAAIAQSAANLVKTNGLKSKIKILRGPADEMSIDEPVDLIVSEWLGNFAYVEGMWDDVRAARDAHLKPEGRMLPEAVSLLLAPMDDSSLYYGLGPGYWRQAVHGLDFSSLEAKELEQGKASQIRIEPGTLLASGQTLSRTEMRTVSGDGHFCEGVVEFEIQRTGTLTGFGAWFNAHLSPGVDLNTGPECPETHWAQTVLFCEPLALKAGERLSVAYRLDRHPDEPRFALFELEWAGRSSRYQLE